MTFVDNDGRHIAALVHDAALSHQPELLEVVCAAANVAIERERLQAELSARVVELQRVARADRVGGRRRAPPARAQPPRRRPAAARRRSRSSCACSQGHIHDDPSAEQLVTTASDELALSMAELRELARGLHPAVLEHGLAAALEALAARSTVDTTVSYEPPGRLPEAGRAGRVLRRLRGAGQRRQVRAGDRASRCASGRPGRLASIEVADDGIGGADDAAGSGLRGLADRVEALQGHLRVVSPPGAGTTVTAELPCGS